MSIDYYDVPSFKGKALVEIETVNPISDVIIETIVNELHDVASEECYIHEQYGLNYVALIVEDNCGYSEEPETVDFLECQVPETIMDIFKKYEYKEENISMSVNASYDVG